MWRATSTRPTWKQRRDQEDRVQRDRVQGVKEQLPLPLREGVGGRGRLSARAPLSLPRVVMTRVLDVRALRKYYPIHRGLLGRVAGEVRAVDDVSFTIDRGETLSLVGERAAARPPPRAASCARSRRPPARSASAPRAARKSTWHVCHARACGRCDGRCR
jgi:hypothetical protein